MKTSRIVATIQAAVLAAAWLGSASVRAHELIYPGTVLAVQAERLHVRTVDPDTKKGVSIWFAVTDRTRVKRGDLVVAYAAAKIAKDERIVVVVNHDDDADETVATELRLAAR